VDDEAIADPLRRPSNSPDNFTHNDHHTAASTAQLHSAPVVGTPKMPGEPPRVQPSEKVAEHWDEDGNRVD
jgi:hypothetical protein